MSKEIQSHILTTFEIKNFLGSGAYGHVWKVVHKDSGKEYALKKIFDAFQNDVDAQRTYRQISILHQLDHLNIIKLEWVIKAQNARDLYLVFEYMETDLHSIVGQNILGSSHIRFIAYQLCKVLKYLHSAQLIHRDIKTSNILLSSNCEIKLCDFGLVRSMLHEEDTPLILSEDVATRWYRSPQMLLGSQQYGKATDIWSVGCVLAQLLNRQPLFPGGSNIQQIQKVLEFTGIPSKETLRNMNIEGGEILFQKMRIQKKPIKIYFKQCDDKQLKQLILRMLQFDPSNRITAEEALQLESFQEFRGKSLENTCKRFVFTEVDDNTRLTLQEYRRFIYRDIERRYPTLNKSTPMPRIYRSYHSVNSKVQSVGKQESHSLLKKQGTVQSLYQTFVHPYKTTMCGFPKNGKKQFIKLQLQKQKENTQLSIKDHNQTFIVYEDTSNSKVFKRKIKRNLWQKQS